MEFYMGVAGFGILVSGLLFFFSCIWFICSVFANDREEARNTARFAFKVLGFGVGISLFWPLAILLGIIYMGKAAFSAEA